MNRNIAHAIWNRIKERIREPWGFLADDDIENADGRYPRTFGRNFTSVALAAALASIATSVPVSAATASEPGMQLAGDASRSAGTTIDDSWITTKVKTQLMRANGVDGTVIKVKTRNGVVELTGAVDSVAEAELAEKVAAEIQGVEMVQNKLEVGH
jgi:hyperosmotically inducible periplasmic protein